MRVTNTIKDYIYDARKKVIEIVGKEGKSKVHSINLVKEVGGK